MAQIKILIEGYAKEVNNSDYASSTTTLILAADKKIIVDPGMNKQLLLAALKKEGLSTGDIDYVMLTHYHIDHSFLTAIFENAKAIDYSDVFSSDGKIESHDGIIPETNIKIISTPGHMSSHCSVIVETEEFGMVVIAADVIWWSDEEEQKTDGASLIKHEDPYAENMVQLIESRKKILEIADYIVPGHGKMFKVEK
mgnify:CR=1 FL=1